MFKYFLSLMGYPSASSVYQKQSHDALGVFQKILDKLSKINEEIDYDYQANQQVVKSLEAENEDLQQIKDTNNTIIGRINNILE